MMGETAGETDWNINEPSRAAYYVRRSTFEQENQHQIESIRDFLDEHGLDIAEVGDYVETASGAKRDREELMDLMEAIQNGEIDHVIVWELSRIARDGLVAQEFFTLCEDEDVVIHVTDGNVQRITPDGQNRLVADIYASIYADERRTLVRRTKLGQKRAYKAGKWVGNPPLGFTTDGDGYLIPNVEFYGDEYNEEKDGFFKVQAAIEDIDNGESYRSAAMNMECTRQVLSNIDQDGEKRRWYLEQEADDERVQTALEELDEIES